LPRVFGELEQEEHVQNCNDAGGHWTPNEAFRSPVDYAPDPLTCSRNVEPMVSVKV
jgi:hypothetical protein